MRIFKSVIAFVLMASGISVFASDARYAFTSAPMNIFLSTMAPGLVSPYGLSNRIIISFTLAETLAPLRSYELWDADTVEWSANDGVTSLSSAGIQKLFRALITTDDKGSIATWELLAAEYGAQRGGSFAMLASGPDAHWIFNEGPARAYSQTNVYDIEGYRIGGTSELGSWVISEIPEVHSWQMLILGVAFLCAARFSSLRGMR